MRDLTFSEILERKMAKHQQGPTPPATSETSNIPPLENTIFPPYLFYDQVPKKPRFNPDSLLKYQNIQAQFVNAVPEDTKLEPQIRENFVFKGVIVSELSEDARRALSNLRDLGALNLYKRQITPADIKSGFRQLTLRFHPDQNTHKSELALAQDTQKFIEARANYRTLIKAVSHLEAEFHNTHMSKDNAA